MEIKEKVMVIILNDNKVLLKEDTNTYSLDLPSIDYHNKNTHYRELINEIYTKLKLNVQNPTYRGKYIVEYDNLIEKYNVYLVSNRDVSYQRGYKYVSLEDDIIKNNVKFRILDKKYIEDIKGYVDIINALFNVNSNTFIYKIDKYKDQIKNITIPKIEGLMNENRIAANVYYIDEETKIEEFIKYIASEGNCFIKQIKDIEQIKDIFILIDSYLFEAECYIKYKNMTEECINISAYTIEKFFD